MLHHALGNYPWSSNFIVKLNCQIGTNSSLGSSVCTIFGLFHFSISIFSLPQQAPHPQRPSHNLPTPSQLNPHFSPQHFGHTHGHEQLAQQPWGEEMGVSIVVVVYHSIFFEWCLEAWVRITLYISISLYISLTSSKQQSQPASSRDIGDFKTLPPPNNSP